MLANIMYIAVTIGLAWTIALIIKAIAGQQYMIVFLSCIAFWLFLDGWLVSREWTKEK
jgi:hypothetical protein